MWKTSGIANFFRLFCMLGLIPLFLNNRNNLIFSRMFIANFLAIGHGHGKKTWGHTFMVGHTELAIILTMKCWCREFDISHVYTKCIEYKEMFESYTFPGFLWCREEEINISPFYVLILHCLPRNPNMATYEKNYINLCSINRPGVAGTVLQTPL